MSTSSNSESGAHGGRLDDPAFWTDLQQTFEHAIELLREIADSHGLDASAATASDLAERESRLDDMVRTHPLALSAEEYAVKVNRWFQRAKERIHSWGRDAARAADLDAVTSDLENEVASMQEAVEGLAEQRHRIHVKLLRALREQKRPELDLPAKREDAEASAIDAYQGVAQSIQYWMRMREFFPEEEDAILSMLVHLKNLQESIAAEFGSAMRPT